MRTPGELRVLAVKLYTGNWHKDSQCVLVAELEDYRKEWDAEAGRRADFAERGRRVMDRTSRN